MPRPKKLSPEDAMALVLAGLKGDIPVSDLCRQYGISVPTYYKIRDRFLEAGKHAIGTSASKDEKRELYKRIEELESALGRKQLEVELLKKASGLLRKS